MKKQFPITCLLFVCMALSVSAHDLFLKLDTYYLPPDAKATVRVLNGSFQKSDGKVSRDRLRDTSVIVPNGSVLQDSLTDWRDEEKTSLFNIKTAGAGTYVVGISTKHKEIFLKAADFNDYLEHDGLPDILAERKKNGELGKDSMERYSKHVKAIFQVGNKYSDNFKTPLNYSVEIIPQQNPYELKVGQSLEILCLLEGKPIPNQFVVAGWEKDNKQESSFGARTDENGIARVELKAPGKWYIKFIHMTAINDPKLNYESKWTTLTFEMK
jgi:uncharacterized GH25 family protein